ncbi:hypothetical protein ABZ949_01875 [Micromonospora tulbaghiae]|uniref:hypothetical protein n=1 Tax=Micromonospora tulbaghiae TaxID=479978 RepID=UPI0033E2E00D
MAAKTGTDGFTYEVPAWRWERQRETTLRAALAAARRKRRRLVGEPRVRVILEWSPDDDEGEQMPLLGLEHC